jgi:3-hydroxyisobutyrate dehydrogenase-like beta-hydroxyacid dehydrogenase
MCWKILRSGRPFAPSARTWSRPSTPPSFKLRLADKDLRLVTEAGDEALLDLKAARATRAWFDEAMEEGAGDLDFSAVVATIAEGHASGEMSEADVPSP